MKFNYYALKLVGICVFVFILQMAFNGFTDMFVLDQSAYTQTWRFLTSIFLHGDITHLIYNMFALALFGSILERIIGGNRFLLIYFGSGILANILAINFYTSSLGASGAIYGVLGALVILRPLMTVFAFGLPMPMLVAGILWASGDVIGLFIPSNTGHIAHLSGMVVGIVIGAYLRRRFREENRTIGGIILDENRMRNWEDAYIK